MNKKRILFLLLSILIIFVIEVTIINEKRIDSTIREKNIVFTPQGVAKKSHSEFLGRDIFEYWIFELNEEQVEMINKELANEEWQKINGTHRQELQTFFDFEDDYYYVFSNDSCFICVYDDYNEEVIVEMDKYISEITNRTIMFVYDSKSNYYICIHQTR